MLKRRPERDGAVQLGGELHCPTENPSFSQSQARQFRVIIARDLWRRCVVSVEPATITHQPRSFRDYPAAIVFAEGLAQLEGWPILDRAGGEQ